MSKVKIALIQMSMTKDLSLNIKTAIQAIEKASKKGAKVVLLPELFTTLYFPQDEKRANFKLAESIPGPTTDILCSVAKKNKVVITVPIFEKRTQGLYHNTCAVIDADGKYLGKYRKMHIPDDPCFSEKYYFAPGDLGYKVFETKYLKLGVLICWDQWYPEAARCTALKGAQLLVYPTAIGWHDSEKPQARKDQLKSWQVIQTSHAVSNGVFVASINRTGKERKLNFWGSSFISSPTGNILTQAKVSKNEILIATLDLNQIDKQREEWPFLRDRRIDSYKLISKRYIDAKA